MNLSGVVSDPSGRTFEPIRLLGEGGFGEVHLCRMTSVGGLNRAVAVKLLRRGLDPRGQAVERLRDEAKLLVSLHHPVVLAALDLVDLDGRVALVTEFVEGQDLSRCIEGDDRMPWSTLLEVVEQIASALTAAWTQLKVVHRDIKPGNIRIGLHGTVKLLDFGIARSELADRSARTASEMLVGTVRYLAPERFDLGQPPLPASDVFSLGCVVYEGVTGQMFLAEVGPAELVKLSMMPAKWDRYVEDRVAAVAAISRPLGELVRTMLALDPAARPDAAEVALRCEQLAAQAPTHIPMRRWCRERRWPTDTRAPKPSGAPGTRWLLNPPTPGPAGSAMVEPMSGSLVTPRSTYPVPLPPQRAGWLRWTVATLAGATTLAVGLAVVTVPALILLLVWLSWPIEPAPRPSPGPAPIDAPQPMPVVATPPADPGPPVAAPDPPAPRHPTPAPAHPAVPVAPTSPTPAAPAPSEPTPAAPVELALVTFASKPNGGVQVQLASTGEFLGSTPFSRKLPVGAVAVRFVVPDTGTVRNATIEVGATPRYVWHYDTDTIETGQ